MRPVTIIAVLLTISFTTPALAYIGPGAGIGAIGTVVAVIGAILLMIAGFVWYPIKRMLKLGKKPPETTDEITTDDQ